MDETMRLDTFNDDPLFEQRIFAIRIQGKSEEGDETSRRTSVSKDSVFSNSSVLGTSFNFVNSIIGTSVIGFPYAVSQCGLAMALLLFSLVGFITDFTVRLLIATAEEVGVKTYQELVDAALGRLGYIILVLLQFLYPFICLISYNIMIEDTVTKVIKGLFTTETFASSILSDRYFIILATSVFVMLPLSLLRNISKLSKTSLASCVLLLFILVVMFIRLLPIREKVYRVNSSSAITWFGDFNGISDSFSIMAFGFMNQHNTFLLYHSMNNRTYKNWSIVAHCGVFFSMCISLTFGITGYLTFTNFTQGDIFENYCTGDELLNGVRLLYAFIVMFSYPLELFVCREVIENTFFYAKKGDMWLHVLITVTLVFLTVLISFATDCLGIFLEFNGTLVACTLAFVLPTVCAIKVNYKQGKPFTDMSTSFLVCIIGVFFVITGSISLLTKAFNGYTCSHGKELAYCQLKKPSFFSALNNNSSLYMA